MYLVVTGVIWVICVSLKGHNIVLPLEFLDLDINRELPALESMGDICFRILISAFKCPLLVSLSLVPLVLLSTGFLVVNSYYID